MKAAPKTRFTAAAFYRSHMKGPRGQGCWAFQACLDWPAFDRHLVGPMVFFNGTLTQAKAQAAAAFPGQLVAVLP